MLLLPLACTTVEREGPRLAVEELARECRDTHVRGTMERAEHQQLRLKLTAESSCKVTEADTVTTERYGRSYIVTAIIAAVITVAVAIPCAIGSGMLATSVSDAKGARGTGETLGILPGIAAGLAAAAGVPPIEARLEDGPPKRIEKEVTTEGKRAPSGLLHVSGDLSRSWSLDDGKALIPIADAVTVKLSQLELGGIPVQLDSAGNTLDLSLDPCRAALEGFKPTEAPVCPDAGRRFELAKQCSRNGWDVALPVEAKFGAIRCTP